MATLKNVVSGVKQNAIEGESTTNGRGVQGRGDRGMGVAGISDSSAGVRGDSTTGRGVEGWSEASEGVFGRSKRGIGVYGEATGTHGVRGGVGIFGKGPAAAGQFEGKVFVSDVVTADNFVLPNGDTLTANIKMANATRIVTTLQIKELQAAVLKLYTIVGKTPPKFTK